jgi:ribosomal protein S4
MDSLLFSTIAGRSSKEKEKDQKKAEKAAKRAQLAAQLRARQLQQAAERGPEAALRAKGAQNGSAAWEENGAMYSLDGIF